MKSYIFLQNRDDEKTPCSKELRRTNKQPCWQLLVHRNKNCTKSSALNFVSFSFVWDLSEPRGRTTSAEQHLSYSLDWYHCTLHSLHATTLQGACCRQASWRHRLQRKKVMYSNKRATDEVTGRGRFQNHRQRKRQEENICGSRDWHNQRFNIRITASANMLSCVLTVLFCVGFLKSCSGIEQLSWWNKLESSHLFTSLLESMLIIF